MPNDELVAYLQSHPIFGVLDPAHIDLLARHAEEQQCAAGAVLFRQQEPAESFFILREGSVMVEVPSISGPPLEVQTLASDDVLGWSWLIPPYRWTFEAKAYQDCRLLRFDGAALLAHCEQDKNFGYALMKLFAGLMSQRLHAARMRMMDSWAPAGWA